MFERINWKQEWRFSTRREREPSGNFIDVPFEIELFDDKQTLEVICPKKEYIFETTNSFYDFGKKSKLIYAHIIPNEKLSFTVQSLHFNHYETKVLISKLNEDSYKIRVYRTEISTPHFYHPPKEIVETLTKKELSAKLSLIISTFDDYPLLTLPFGNCFSI